MSEPIEGNSGSSTGGAKPMPEILPRPSVWPAALSFAVTLLAFGVVTSWIISAVGFALFLLSAHGWFEDLRNDGR
jgi:hypothetical protein